MRFLYLPHDPDVTAVLATYDLRDDPRYRPDEWRAAVEALVTRELAPPEWIDHVESWTIRPFAMPVAIRNPRAIMAAERLLRDALTQVASEAQARDAEESWVSERIVGLLNAYGGVTTYDAARARLVDLHDGYDAARRVPAARFGYADGWDWDSSTLRGRRISPAWDERERLFSWPAALGYSALAGPEWVRAIYALGLGVAHLRCPDDRNRWHLIVRDGEGWKWPTLERAA